MSKQNFKNLLNEGALLHAQGALDMAEEKYLKAMDLDANNPTLLNNIGFF